ncbi:MAG: MATE family efflux transporter [Armatimonadetes bacterium]|nr:MATE family efflux transporter [Armatimonadota bacterium]
MKENATRVVWALAWPAVALNGLQTLNALLDTFFVGHLQSAALTAMGATVNVMFLFFSLAMTIGTAATAIVSRAYGAKDQEEMVLGATKATGLATIAGLVMAGITVLVIPFATSFLLPTGAGEAKKLMAIYLGIYATALPAIYVIQSLAGSLRAIGDTKSPMVISGIQILLHMLMNFLFIRVFNMGLAGAGLSLSLSAWFSVLGYLAFMPRTPLGSLWRIRPPGMDWARRLLRIALPAALMSALRVFSLIAFTIVLKYTANGEAAIGAMRVAFSIEPIMFMPAFGLSVSAATLVGQSLGMKKPDRAEKLAWTAGHHGALIAVIMAIPVFFFAEPIAMGLTGGKVAMAQEAANLLRWLSVTEAFFAYGMVMTGAMQGAGETKLPLWITIFSMWLVRTPLSYILALPLAMGPTGAWIGMSVSQMIAGGLSAWGFSRGSWKTQTV